MTWTAGLAVALGAGVATAHGLYQVAAASGVPHPVAWLYPLITDGLALVAYAATARLHSTGRRYAAVVVVGAAGLSGLAQAVYLAGGITTHATAPVGLRFGVGFWPAAAAAIAAHLLHLIGSGDGPAEATAAGVEDQRTDDHATDPRTEPGPVSNAAASNRPSNPSNPPASNPPVQPLPLVVCLRYAAVDAVIRMRAGKAEEESCTWPSCRRRQRGQRAGRRRRRQVISQTDH